MIHERHPGDREAIARLEVTFSPLEAVYMVEQNRLLDELERQRELHAARLKRDGQMMCWMFVVGGFFGFLIGWGLR